MLDEIKAVKEQLAGVRALPQLAIDPGLEIERVRVANFIRRDDTWTQRAVGVPRFAHSEGRYAPLPIPHAHVIGDRVANNDLTGAVFRDMPTVAPNHHGELPFIIELLGSPRQVDVPVGA